MSDEYDAIDDVEKSIEVARAEIRKRMAEGGPDWQPAPCDCPCCRRDDK